MSNSSIHKTLIAAIVAVALAIAGCGSSSGGGAKTTASSPTVQSGAASTAGTGASAGTGATAGVNGTGGATASPDTEAQLVPVDVRLSGDGFAPSTPSKFHVPSKFLILVNVRSSSPNPLSLSVLATSIAQTFRIPAHGEQKISLNALDSGDSIKLMIGNQTVLIVADADPGP